MVIVACFEAVAGDTDVGGCTVLLLLFCCYCLVVTVGIYTIFFVDTFRLIYFYLVISYHLYDFLSVLLSKTYSHTLTVSVFKILRLRLIFYSVESHLY